MKIVKNILRENYTDLDFLRDEFGREKIYPPTLELPILISLSYFPELKNCRIEFKEKKTSFAFASRPDFSDLHFSISNRKYQIVLSTESSYVPKDLLFRALPLNAQIGILGHELSHTVYYLNKTAGSILKIGLRYFHTPFRIRFENATDIATIERGLGYQLLEFSTFCYNHPKASEKYKKWLDKYYLNPMRIMNYINQLTQYADLEKN